MQVHNYVHPVIFCGVGANAAAAALGAVQQQPHAEVLRTYMHKVIDVLGTLPVYPCARLADMSPLSPPSGSHAKPDVGAQGGGGFWLLKFLGVIILSFGFRLFERRRLIWRHAAAILGGVAFAVISSLFATALAARLLQLPSGGLRCSAP